MTKEFIIALIDKVSPSGKVYPREVMEAVVEKANARANEGTLVGVFEEVWPTKEGITDLNHISHLVKKLRIDGNMVIAEVEILETARGYKLAELLKDKKILSIAAHSTGEEFEPLGGNFI